MESGQPSGIALGHRLNDRGFESLQGVRIYLFITASRPALGPTQPRIEWVPVAVSLGVKRPGREANHSPPSSAEVTPTPPLPNKPSWGKEIQWEGVNWIHLAQDRIRRRTIANMVMNLPVP
jgi:hypothetical protein